MYEVVGKREGIGGEYLDLLVTSGDVVSVPTTTGFSFIDRQLALNHGNEGNTLVSDRRPNLFVPKQEVRDWMVQDAVRKSGVLAEVAPAAMTGMQAFLSALADHSGLILTPSKPVDEMWHRFMTRPGDYWQACAEAGAFIDHVPNEPDGSKPPGALDVARTYQFLLEHGYGPDPMAWPAGEAGGDCGGQWCYGDDCTSGGPPMFQALRVSRLIDS